MKERKKKRRMRKKKREKNGRRKENEHPVILHPRFTAGCTKQSSIV